MPSLGSGFKRIAIVNASGWVLSDQTPDSNLGCGVAVTGQTRLQVVFFSWNSAIWGGPTGTRMNLSCKKPKRGGTDKSKGGNFNLARRDGTSEVLNLSAPTNWACAAFCICVVTGTFPFCCFCSGWVLQPFLNLLEKGTSWGERDLDLDWTKKILSHQAWIQYLHICKTHTYI